MNGFSIDVEALRAQHQTASNSTSMSTPGVTPTTPDPKLDPPMPTVADPKTGSAHNEFSGWNLLCQAIDRVLFISYLAIILIFIASYLGGAALASVKPSSD